MTDIRSVQAGKFNKTLAEALKKSGDFPKPEWVDFVKTSPHLQRPCADEDFWYKRSANILRKILQQADEAGITEKASGKKAGRKLTVKGKAFIEDFAK